MINYGKHFIDKSDIKAVVSVLKKKALTQGKVTDLFEKKLKKYFGSKYVVAVSSGTSALNLIANCLKWKKEDIIFCSPITFAAGSNCIVNQGAKPFFVDIDLNTFNLDFPESWHIYEFIKVKDAKKANKIALNSLKNNTNGICFSNPKNNYRKVF